MLNDSNVVVGTSGPQFVNFTALGLAHQYVDAAKGGSGGMFPATLGSYDDGTGLLGLTWETGTPVALGTFDVKLGYASGGAFYPANSFDYVYSVNSLPGPVPEPGAGVVVVGMMMMGLVRRGRCR